MRRRRSYPNPLAFRQALTAKLREAAGMEDAAELQRGFCAASLTKRSRLSVG